MEINRQRKVYVSTTSHSENHGSLHIQVQMGVGGKAYNAYCNKLESNCPTLAECGTEEIFLCFSPDQRDFSRNLSLVWVGSQA